MGGELLVKVIEAVKTRRSIRNFQDREISDKETDRLIEALIWAPSAGNLQSRKFYFVTDPETKDSLCRAALNQTFIAEAPLIIVGCADQRIANRYGLRGMELYCIQDVACSIMCMMLVAHEMGLGSAWVGAFHEDEAADILGLPGHLRPVVIAPVGWPEEVPPAPKRFGPEEAVVWVRG
ncbi:MAG: nitroreductase family protein [Nitrospirae bacterium]|nr:nitroreductase family protein [Nitrospirota bacterium]